MSQRPLSVTLVSYLFIATGVVGFAYHAIEFQPQAPFDVDWLLVMILRILAFIAGVFMLRGANWARWLAIVWLAYHVVLSAFHSWSETAVHTVLLAVVAYVVLRKQGSAFFRGGRPPNAAPQRT